MQKMKYLSILLLFIVFIVSGCLDREAEEVPKETLPLSTGGGLHVKETQPEYNISKEEEEFNNSGRAKAVESADDLLQFDDNEQMSEVSIIGKWVSVDDDKSVIEFTNDKKIDIYDGKIVSENNYQRSADGYDIVLELEDGDMYYNIMEANNEVLKLIYLPVGRILEYRR